MRIYTGYFAQLRKYELRSLTPIGIARKPPSFFKEARYLTFHPLCPSEQLLWDFRNGLSKEAYIERYVSENLIGLDAQDIFDMLRKYSGGHDVILLCYEKPELFCHRHIVSEWLNQNDIPCEEFLLNKIR